MSLMLTTVDAVKDALGLDVNDSNIDDIICRKIKSISDRIQRELGISLELKEHETLIVGNDSKSITLPFWPVRELTKVENLITGTDETEAFTKKYLISNSKRNVVITDETWTRNPSVKNINDMLEISGSFAYSHRVFYTAGYILPGENGRDLPYDIEGTVIDLVANYVMSRSMFNGLQGITKIQQGDISYSFVDPSKLESDRIKSLAKIYKINSYT